MKKLILISQLALFFAVTATADVKVIKSELHGTGYEFNTGLLYITNPYLMIDEKMTTIYAAPYSAFAACEMVGRKFVRYSNGYIYGKKQRASFNERRGMRLTTNENLQPDASDIVLLTCK